MSNTETTLPSTLGRLRALALIAGPAGLGLALVVALIGTDFNIFMRGYLYAFIVWFAVPMGSLAFLMIHHMTGGAWSFVTQRIFEAATRTLPLMFILFLPILLGPLTPIHGLYDAWVHPESEVVQSKALFLDPGFWTLRAIGYFALWGFLAWLLNRWSARLEESGDALIVLNFRRLAPAGIILYCLSMTFAATDWVMSLEPDWYSTIYGPLFWISQGLTTLAISIVILSLLADEKPLAQYMTIDWYHHLANLMLGFTVLWAYMSFSQFLITWAGNLPEEIHYYLARRSTGWIAVSLFLMFGHFMFPLLILLFRRLKRNVNYLRRICFYILAARLVDVFWFVNPAFHHDAPGIYATDVLVAAAALVGLGGIWMYFFLGQLTKRSLLPLNDPRLYEAVGHGHREAIEHA